MYLSLKRQNQINNMGKVLFPVILLAIFLRIHSTKAAEHSSDVEYLHILGKFNFEILKELKTITSRVQELENEDISTKNELENMKKQIIELKRLNQRGINANKVDVNEKNGVENQNSDQTINKDEPNLEKRVEILEQLSKIGTLRSCEEYSSFGIRSSGMFPIDPDGTLVGAAPFYVYCRFDDKTGEVYTEVLHDHSEVLTHVDHCHDAGCYIQNLTYVSGNDGKVIEISQLESLIDLSSECHQSFYYECTLAPLRFQDVDLAYWTGRDWQKNVFFTGSSNIHSCDCYYDDNGCEGQDMYNNSCNCDANKPTPLVDTGSITKMASLPMTSIAFGGLDYAIQQGYYTIGRLVCKGKNFNEPGTSCRSLKLAGETKSGYYTIKKENAMHTSIVYCDMEHDGYEMVPEYK